MFSLNLKPILKNTYNMEKKQPRYSTFFIEKDGEILPISVNKTGADILRMCNGKNTTTEIINSLTKKYNEVFGEVKESVASFLKEMQRSDVIDYNADFRQIQNIEFGSRDFWTPDNIIVKITDACLLKCKHCSDRDGENTSYIDEDTFYDILFDMKSLNIKHMQIIGGEPLLHKDFFKFLNKAVELGISCEVFTSGYVYNDETINSFKRIKETNKIVVQVSIDGMEKYHDSFRGIRGAFNKSMAFIDSMIDLGITTNVACCMNNQDYNEIENLTKILKNKGVSVMRVTPIDNMGNTSNHAMFADIKNYDFVNEMISKLKISYEDKNFKINNNEKDICADTKSGLSNCGLGQTQLKIDQFGKVYPCMISNLVIGDITEETIKSIQIRNSTIFEKLISPENKTCGGCNNSACTSCIVQELLINENTKNPCIWYDNQLKLINSIRCVNSLKVS